MSRSLSPTTTERDLHSHLLGGKGCIATGRDADLLVLDRKSLDPIEVIAGGARLMKNGTIATREKFLEGSNRNALVKEMRKGRTFFFEPIDPNGFDEVIDPIILGGG